RGPPSDARTNPGRAGLSSIERLALRAHSAHLPSRSQKSIRTDESRSAQEPCPAPRNPQRIGCASARGALNGHTPTEFDERVSYQGIALAMPKFVRSLQPL